jgi:tRNA pseudouridine synthase B
MLIACDKPSGISSFDVVKIIRTYFQDKVGHSGTLDPMASGLMILGVGKGTKSLTALIGMDKSYETVIDFSLLTDTRDASFWEKEERFEVITEGGKQFLKKEGNLISAPELSQILELLKSICYQEGKEVLLPLPTFSAKKQNGKRMYKDARK